MAKKKTTKKTSTKKTTINTAVKGSSTKGTEIGVAREIESSKLAPTVLAQKEQLAPIERVEAAQIDKAPQEEFRKRQLSFADSLTDQIEGRGPSIAGVQLQEATDRNIAQQMAVARSGGGALARRQALSNIGTLGQQAARDAAKQRFAEMLSAQQQLQAVLGSGRASDIEIATAQANLNDAAARANAAAYNTQVAQQGQLNQNVELANQGAQNQASQAQAQLDQGAAISNQGAVNTRSNNQAQINASLSNARTSAGAAVAAAGAGASASRYATDAGLYKFNQELGFEMDKYYGGQTGSNIQGGYNTDTSIISQEDAIRARQNQALDNAGGSIASLGGGSKTDKVGFANAIR